MQTVKRIRCTQCGELNYEGLVSCDFCGVPTNPRVLPSSFMSADAPDREDLPPLLWALVCMFIAVWGLEVAGPLRVLLGVLTNPYLLIGSIVLSALLTGLFLSERTSLKHRPPSLLSSRDIMALSWTFAALVGASRLVKYVTPAMPVILPW